LLLLGIVLSLSGFASQVIAADTNAPAGNIDPDITSPAAAPSWLGVWIDDIPASLGSHLSPILKKNQGLIIQKTYPDSPANKAGLRAFDIITKFNDQDIFSKRQLTQLIQSSQPGTTVELSLIRQGQLMTQSVTLAALPAKQPPMMRHKHHPRMPSMPPNFGTGSRHLMPPPWMNEPFFNPDFDRYLQKRFQQMDPAMAQKNNWAQFESIQIESTGEDKHRAEVKFEDSEGNKKHFVFEGNFNEIRQQIMAQEDMDEDKKQNLLQALEMNTSPPLPPFGQHGFMAPDWYQQPLPGPNWLPNKP
jgi:hypothetical protein